MDKSFMREFYRIFYADSFPNTVKELEAYLVKRENRYKSETELLEILGGIDSEAHKRFNEYLDACAEEVEILLEEIYLLGASDREKMLKQ